MFFAFHCCCPTDFRVGSTAQALSKVGTDLQLGRHRTAVQCLQVCVASAPHHVLTKEKLAPMMHPRPARPLFCIDLAVPRDFEPAVNDLDGVYLYDIDSLQRIADDSLAVRRQELVVCEEMIERHVGEFSAWLAEGTRGPKVEFRAQPEGAKS